MFIRRNRRKKNGEVYEYWTLVESVRTPKGPRQRVVANIGKGPGLDEQEQLGWEQIGRILDGEEETQDEQLSLFEEEPAAQSPLWANVNLRSIQVKRLRQFGKPYLALALWRRLQLHRFFEEHLPAGRERCDWDQIAFVLSCGRFCEQASELALAERWYAKTALEDLIGIPAEKIYDNRLYRGLDAILPLREKLFSHLKKRYEGWFGSRFEFLLYDITSTYFEGECKRNPQAQRGYSRDSRSDCKQVCIGLVVTPEGLPLAYELFDGNRADVTTVEEIVDAMEKQYGAADRIWVMDRGMVSEANLDYLREKGALYIVGTPKSRLKAFERELLEQEDWNQVHEGVEVKLVEHPDAPGLEQYVLCRSSARANKERAMLDKQRERLRKKLEELDRSLRKRPQDPEKTGRRIGRWLGRNTVAEKIFSVEVEHDENGRASGLVIEEDERKAEWANHAHGAYLLRTNCLNQDPKSLWRWYIQLTQAEEAFRCSKSDLGLRPVFHQIEERVQAHILVCFLSLVMWRSLGMWLCSKGLGNCPRQLLLELDEVRSMDIIAEVKSDTPVRLRVVGKPDRLCAILLQQLGLKLPTRPKIIENVVEKNQ